MLQALDFTATIALWVEWDEHHSSPQPETDPMEEGPAIGEEGVEGDLGQTPGPWFPFLPHPTTAGRDSTESQGSLKPTIMAPRGHPQPAPTVRGSLKGRAP